MTESVPTIPAPPNSERTRRFIRRIWEGSIHFSDETVWRIDTQDLVKVTFWRPGDELVTENGGPCFVTHLRRGVSVWAERVLL